METNWNYSSLAEFYDKRADYSDDAIQALLKKTGVEPGSPVADVGAGTGKLTKLLLKFGMKVNAVEPNNEMRARGQENTAGKEVTWSEATGEATNLPDHNYALVTFGSSFNVVDRAKALEEVKRILKPEGWFACMWNHRDLEDPIQAKVESTIQSHVADYSLGVRRQDQTEVINESGLFHDVHKIEGAFTVTVSKHDYMEAWRSHATLERQAGDKFAAVIEAIESVLPDGDSLEVPYVTRIWCAQLKA